MPNGNRAGVAATTDSPPIPLPTVSGTDTPLLAGDDPPPPIGWNPALPSSSNLLPRTGAGRRPTAFRDEVDYLDTDNLRATLAAHQPEWSSYVERKNGKFRREVSKLKSDWEPLRSALIAHAFRRRSSSQRPGEVGDCSRDKKSCAPGASNSRND